MDTKAIKEKMRNARNTVGQEFIGKSKIEIEAVMKERNNDYRIISEDGEHYFVTMDYNMSRYNFGVNKGVITSVSMG